MYMDANFTNKFIGLEGGTGETIGGLLGILDVISLNRRSVLAAIECGGLCVEHVNGLIVQPYHGSASAVTQLTEVEMDEQIAESRLDDAGDLEAIEGQPNFMRIRASVPSMAIAMKGERALAVGALADQQSRSIYELRRHIRKSGPQHRNISGDARVVAEPHRGNR